MSWSCLAGWSPISRADLHEIVRESIANEPKERKRLLNAIDEFEAKAKGVTDTKKRVRIMKEVAEKYGYNEDYFMEKLICKTMTNEKKIAIAAKLLKESTGYYKNAQKYDIVSFDIKIDKKPSGRKEIIVFPKDKYERAFYWSSLVSNIADVLCLSFYLKIREEQICAIIYHV